MYGRLPTFRYTAREQLLTDVSVGVTWTTSSVLDPCTPRVTTLPKVPPDLQSNDVFHTLGIDCSMNWNMSDENTGASSLESLDWNFPETNDISDLRSELFNGNFQTDQISSYALPVTNSRGMTDLVSIFIFSMYNSGDVHGLASHEVEVVVQRFVSNVRENFYSRIQRFQIQPPLSSPSLDRDRLRIYLESKLRNPSKQARSILTLLPDFYQQSLDG